MGMNGIMWVKQCHKPPMTGNGKFIPPIKMVMTGGWFMIVLATLTRFMGGILVIENSLKNHCYLIGISLGLYPH